MSKNNWIYLIRIFNASAVMLNYRLTPLGVISISDNTDKETARANPILQNISNFEAFWYAMKNYKLVTADDLRNEFWSICPDLESIPKFLDVMNVKFDAVNYRYDTDINTIKEQYNGLNELVKAEKISGHEADEMFWNIHFIADRHNFIMDYIIDIYRGFRKMVKPQQTNTDSNLQQITIPDNILNNLREKGFIENTDVKALKWIATNKKTKGKTLNKKSLFDLLCLLEYPDNVIKDRVLLNSIFTFPNGKKLTPQNYTDITDSRGAIKRQIISEYHTELESILNQTDKEK
jgi:hypothetical protein